MLKMSHNMIICCVDMVVQLLDFPRSLQGGMISVTGRGGKYHVIGLFFASKTSQ